MIRITPAQAWEADWLASHLRREDAAELEAATRGRTAAEVVPEAFRLSRQCLSIRAALQDSPELNPCAMFGVCDNPQLPQWGVVWLLATPRVALVKTSVMKVAPHWLDEFARAYEFGLNCLVDSRNGLHLRWILKNRFTIADTFNHSSVPFFYCVRPNAGVSSV